MSLNFYCTKFPLDFGQFPIDGPFDGTCTSLTRQGVTKNVAETEIGVILTDKNGKGSVSVVIGPVQTGTYEVTFFVRNAAGCNVSGGGCAEHQATGALSHSADNPSPASHHLAETIRELVASRLTG